MTTKTLVKINFITSYNIITLLVNIYLIPTGQ